MGVNKGNIWFKQKFSDPVSNPVWIRPIQFFSKQAKREIK